MKDDKVRVPNFQFLNQVKPNRLKSVKFRKNLVKSRVSVLDLNYLIHRLLDLNWRRKAKFDLLKKVDQMKYAKVKAVNLS